MDLAQCKNEMLQMKIELKKYADEGDRELLHNLDSKYQLILAKLEWDLCVELHRNNPLLDIMAAKLGVTSQQLDYIFRAANGEDVTLQVENEEKSNTNETVLPEDTTETTLYT